MLELSERAREELEHTRTALHLLPEQAVRLAPDSAGTLRLFPDTAHASDIVVHEESGPMLVFDRQVASALSGAVLDYDTDEDGASGTGFVVRRLVSE